MKVSVFGNMTVSQCAKHLAHYGALRFTMFFDGVNFEKSL